MDKLADARAVFEKLYKEQAVFIENTHGYDSQKFALWAGFQLGWQASRESLEVELPDPFIANENCETWCYDEDLVNQALISNGVKIKNES
ncbi:hypothetical protein WMR86_06535 [Proteus vulgaris]|nr:hypothetical protein [Proteus terrae]QHD95012.1 hypothetical protein GSM99_11110 [Proteus terrae subsp. cibarius]QJW50331.1 hypothetical protein HND96_05280 [Proteus terrae subsp. cibarius]HEK0725582.1 hypothetical protein [Proteus mirabilis]